MRSPISSCASWRWTSVCCASLPGGKCWSPPCSSWRWSPTARLGDWSGWRSTIQSCITGLHPSASEPWRPWPWTIRDWSPPRRPSSMPSSPSWSSPSENGLPSGRRKKIDLKSPGEYAAPERPGLAVSGCRSVRDGAPWAGKCFAQPSRGSLRSG